MLSYKKRILLVLILTYSTFGYTQIRFNKTFDFIDIDSSVSNSNGTDFIELVNSNYLVHAITGNQKIFDTLNFDKYYVLLNLIDKNGNRIDSNKISVKGKQIIGNRLVSINKGQNYLAGRILDYKKYLDSNIQSDIVLFRLTDRGDTIWAKTYSFGHGIEFITDIIPSKDRNLLIYGNSYSKDNTDCDLYLLKLDTNGNVLIKQKYSYTSSSIEYAGGIQIKDENIYLLASSNGDTSGVKAEIFKINRLGQLVSIIRLPTVSDFDRSFYTEDLLIDKDRSFIIIGQELDEDTWTFTGHIVKLDSNYNLLWKQTINNKVGSDYFSIIEFNNNYFVAGNRLNTKNDFANPYLTSFSKNGTLRYDRKINFSNSIYESGLVYNLKLTRDTGLAIIGYCEYKDTVYNQYTWFFKTDTLGCFVDGCTFNGIESMANIHDITVYPNPASDKLFMYGVEGKEIEVIDLNGRSILKTTYDFYGIDLLELPSGLYTIKINVANQYVYRKFVKY